MSKFIESTVKEVIFDSLKIKDFKCTVTLFLATFLDHSYFELSETGEICMSKIASQY